MPFRKHRAWSERTLPFVVMPRTSALRRPAVALCSSESTFNVVVTAGVGVGVGVAVGEVVGDAVGEALGEGDVLPLGDGPGL